MKPIRSLFLFAIGMIAFTATATTAKLEQKQKTELVVGFAPYTNTVSVVNEFYVVEVSTKTTVVASSHVLSLRIVNEPITFTAIITDVGWQISRQHYTDTLYKEKLLENYNLHFKDKLTYSFKLSRESC